MASHKRARGSSSGSGRGDSHRAKLTDDDFLIQVKLRSESKAKRNDPKPLDWREKLTEEMRAEWAAEDAAREAGSASGTVKAEAATTKSQGKQ
jgi:hypothetical protein